MRVVITPLVAAAALLALDAPAGRTAAAGRRDWIGSDACGRCHPAQLAAWRRTAHARAAAGRAGAGRCLACHGTGDAPAGKAYAAEVGCEACHGAGAAYAADDIMRDLPLSRVLGLRDVSGPAARAAVCAGCHRSPLRLPPIDLTLPAHPLIP